MTTDAHPHARRRLLLATLLCLGAAGLAGAAPALAAAPSQLLVRGSQVTSVPALGAEIGTDAPPSAVGTSRAATTAPTGRPMASAARAPKKPKKKKAKSIDLTVIRKAINAAGGPPTARYDARAALTSADRVRRAAKSKSQARRELDGLLKTTTTMARGNRITRDRLPMLTATLQRNAQWWKLGRGTASGQRIQFDGSQVLWQLYPGLGLQLQWLGTFGRGNSLYYTPGPTAKAQLAALIAEAQALRVPRAGGTAWEYFFPFDGGSPPWVSGMAQATGVQVFSRAAGSLARPELLEEAKTAQGILRTPPPSGVQVVDATGTHFLIYSFAPNLKVLNAMTQTVNGIYAYVLAQPADVDARLMLLEGLRWLDSNVDRYMTGSWSLYSLGGAKATSHYQVVARDFLRTLCALLNKDATTAGGGPTGAYPATKICAASATLTKYIGS
ncbi:MAG: D-glucuronyl C5-epimerase family protein [Myxococcales bacterium]